MVVVDDAEHGTREATARLRAELVAAGFDVATRESDGRDARDDVEKDEGVATVRLARDPSTHAAELWVSERLTGKTLVAA